MKYEFHVNKKLLSEKDRKGIDRLIKRKTKTEAEYRCYIDFSWSEWELILTKDCSQEIWLTLLDIGDDGISYLCSIEDKWVIPDIDEVEEIIFSHIWEQMKGQINSQDLKKICIEEPEIVLVLDDDKESK